MRRSASEIINDLEMRVAQLEKTSSPKLVDMKSDVVVMVPWSGFNETHLFISGTKESYRLLNLLETKFSIQTPGSKLMGTYIIVEGEAFDVLTLIKEKLGYYIIATTKASI